MDWPLPPDPLAAEHVRHVADRPDELAELDPFERAAIVYALQELLDLRDTLRRATALASAERDRRMLAEEERDLARAELALVRRAWVTACRNDIAVDASG